MLKYIFFAIIAAIAVFAIWFQSWTGPQQLNFADRWYPGNNEAASTAKTGISYGKDKRQQLDVYTPAGPKHKEANRVLVFFHGGSWRDGERAGYEFLGKAFAARGFVTVIADYRKTPDVIFPAFVEDAAGAIAWTHGNIGAYGGDPDQIYVMGHSAGAHISMLAALDTQYLDRLGLDSNIIKGAIGLAGPYDFLPFEKGGAGEKAMGAWPRPQETQPVTYARKDAPPLLLLTGDKDETVKPRNSSALAAAIIKAGGRATEKIYPGVDHTGIIMAVARPFRDKAPVIYDSVNFIADQAKERLAKSR